MPNALRSDDFSAKETKCLYDKAKKLTIIIVVMGSIRSR